MPAFGMKSVRAAEEAWVQESSILRSEVPTTEDAAAVPRRAPAPPSGALASGVGAGASAPKTSGGFVPTGRFARRAVAPAVAAQAPSSASSPRASHPASSVAPNTPNAKPAAPQPSPVASASAPASAAPHPASSTPKAAAPVPRRPDFAAARAAALHADPDRPGMGDPDDDLGVMDENGALRPALDAQVADPDDETVPEATRPRLFARQQLTARRMIQELGDVRRLPLTELLALEQRAMRTPLEVIEEFRSAYQVEVRSRHATGVHSLKDAIAQHPNETVFLLQYGDNRVVRHTPKTGGAADLLHGLVLSSIPMSAAPFADLQGLLTAPVPAVVPASDASGASPAPDASGSIPSQAATASAPSAPVSPVPVAISAESFVPAVSSPAAPPPEAVPPAPRPPASPSTSAPEAAAQRWSRRPRT